MIASSLRPRARPSASAARAAALPAPPSVSPSIPASTSWPWVEWSAPRAVEQVRELLVADAAQVGDRRQVGVEPLDEVGRQQRQRAAESSDAPGGAETPGRWAGVELPEQRGMGRARPSRSRSAATRPPTVRTMGDRAIARDEVAPTARNADSTPVRIGSTQRSSSSAERGAGSVSATGPGPSTGPDAVTASALAVTGRLCSNQRAAVAPERPLDVLRSSERVLGRAGDRPRAHGASDG